MSDIVVMGHVWLSAFHEIDVMIMLIMSMLNFVKLSCLCA